MSNSGRKGNPAKTSADVKQQCHKQPPVQSEPLVPSTSGERIPRSSSEIQSRLLFASTLINTNDQRSKQNRGQSPLSVLSTSSQCSSAEKQSNTDKSYASSLKKSNLNEHITQTPGQSQPSIQSTQYSNPTSTSRGTTEDQSISFITNIPNFEYVNCLTGSTAAMNHYPRGILPRKKKLTGEYHHGPILNESSGSSDDPLDVTGKSSKTSTELQSMMDHGGSHVPGIDTEEAKTEKPMRSCKEIDDVLKGAKHSSDMQEQTGNLGNKQITDSRDLETKQSGYGTSNNLGSAKSAEERKQNNVVKLEKEPNEFQIMHSKITEKITYSTAWNQGRPMPVAQQDFCTPTPNNNSEKTVNVNVNAKNEDDTTKIVEVLAGADSVQTKQNSCLFNLYFSKTTGSSNGCADGIMNSDVSQNNIPQVVDSVWDDGKNCATKLDDPCKADNDFDYTQIYIPNSFFKKAEKAGKGIDAYLKRVTVTVQGILVKLHNGIKQAKELLEKSQDLRIAAENLQQLLNDYKNLYEKVLPEIENAIRSWGHLPYIEELEKFQTYLNSVDTCLKTCIKKIEAEINHATLEASEIRSKSYRTIKPLSDLYNLKAQIAELQQQLLGIPKLKRNENHIEWITTDLQVANGYLDQNINILKDTEEKYAKAESLLSIDLEGVNGCDIESLLSQFETKIATFTGLYISRLNPEKNYEDTLCILKNKEIILRRKHGEFLAQSELETFVSVTEDLKNQTTNFKGNEKEMTALMKSIESALQKSCILLTNHVFKIPETNRESVKMTIRESVTVLKNLKENLKKVHNVLKSNKDLNALKVKSESLVKSSNNFGGTSSELQELISQLESLLHQNQQISTYGQEALQTKVDSSISSLQTCITSLKHQQPVIEENEKFEKSCLKTSALLKEVDNFRGPSSQIDILFHKLSEAMNHYFTFKSMDNVNLENKIKRMRKEILIAENTLKSCQPLIEAEESFEKSYSQINTILKEVNDFWGPSSEIKDLIQKLNDALDYYSVFQHMGRESLAGKLINVQGEIIIARDNLMCRQPIIEALECLAIIRGQAEGLQKKVFAFGGDMSLLRNYMREVEKLQSGLSAYNTMDNDKVKKEAESVSHTIRNTLLNLESIELQLENEMAESMAVEECAEKQSPDLAQQLEESSNMKWICNIAMQLMSIYRQLSNNGINVMDLNQLRWLEMRNGELERMLVNDFEPKTAHEIKAVSQAKKLCLQIQEMINNNDKHCEEIPSEFNVIRATAMKALEYHTKIFNGDISNNQIHWMETQLIECQTKLDQLELPEGVARESRKDVLNLCNQAMSALKKHSYCKN